MKTRYIKKNFEQPTLDLIQQANNIINEYQAQGHELTLRQLYYQFVSRDLLPNTNKSYGKLGRIVSDGRLAGLISWTSIVDRTRNLKELTHWTGPDELIRYYANFLNYDLWEGQEFAVEVWIEKEALIGVITNICNELDVPYFACKGYVSQSEQWRAGQRIYERSYYNGQQTIVLHLGDHDPSGIDMTRDNQKRLSMFSQTDVIVKRVALNMEQIERFNPPPNPAKITDSRAKEYIREFGNESWELDALSPDTLEEIILQNVEEYIDRDLMDERKIEMHEGREALLEIANQLKE